MFYHVKSCLQIDENQYLSIFYLLDMKEKYLLNGSCENQIDNYRESCVSSADSQFGRALVNNFGDCQWKRMIGLKLLGSFSMSLLYRSLSFATLQSFSKCDKLMDKLHICVIGMASKSAPSFKNLPDILSIPLAFFMSSLLKRFETFGMSIYYQ